MVGKAIFTEVPSWIFNELVEKIKKENITGIHIHYNGNESRGDLVIDPAAGETEKYKEILEFFVKMYCK
mgnify:CR=1 FL=1